MNARKWFYGKSLYPQFDSLEVILCQPRCSTVSGVAQNLESTKADGENSKPAEKGNVSANSSPLIEPKRTNVDSQPNKITTNVIDRLPVKEEVYGRKP